MNAKSVVRERTFTWSDPRDLSHGKTPADGLSWLRMILGGELPPPPFAAALGLRPEEIEPGRVTFSMEAHEWMSNPAVVLHGGMVATLLDTVLTLAIVSKLPAGRSATTIDLHLHYVRPILPTGEKVSATGHAVHVGASIATAEGRVHNAAGKLVAHGTATLGLVDVPGAAARNGG